MVTCRTPTTGATVPGDFARHGSSSARFRTGLRWALKSVATEYIAQSVLHVYRASGAGQAGLTMFGIVWLRRGILVDKDTSVLPSEADAIAAAESRARFVANSHPGREPDSFRLTDATGKILGVFPIRHL
jgi:hypothetical protein